MTRLAKRRPTTTTSNGHICTRSRLTRSMPAHYEHRRAHPRKLLSVAVVFLCVAAVKCRRLAGLLALEVGQVLLGLIMKPLTLRHAARRK